MRVNVNGVAHEVIVGHYVAEFRNSKGESRKAVTAINLETREISRFGTY